MLVQIRDLKALSSVSIMNLRAYLNARGWEDSGRWGARPATIYRKEQSGRSWEILVPSKDTIADYAESVAEAINVLSIVEERSQLDVFYAISAAGADVIRLNSTNGKGNEPLSLRESAGLLSDAYNMIASAARAVERPQAAFRGSISSEVAQYLDSVRPQPGYTQGYVLSLHSPVPAGIGQQDMGDDYTAPFSRQATYKLAQALEYASTAISEATSADTLEPFENVVQYGVSANLCDAVAELARKGQGISITLDWADVRPSIVPDSRFPFSANSSDILVEAARSFRRNQPSFDEQLTAQVIELERMPHEFDGWAVLLSTRDGRLTRIRVKFEQSVYSQVIRAFEGQTSIKLDGDIYPVGARHELRNPRNLAVLSEA